MERDKKRDLSGQIFIGCLFIGLGLGVLYQNLAVGTLLGIGSGFILKGIIESKRK